MRLKNCLSSLSYFTLYLLCLILISHSVLSANNEHRSNSSPQEIPQVPAAYTSAQYSKSYSSDVTPTRSLNDWQLKNVLLATLEGELALVDRATGQELWRVSFDGKPMVHVEYGRENPKMPVKWIIEPSMDGRIFVASQDEIHKLPMTVNQLATGYSPWEDSNMPYVYVSKKETSIVTFNATNGEIMNVFSPGEYSFTSSNSCPSDGNCVNSPSITIGRTTYTISIQNRLTAEKACNIQYTEWTPNVRDMDLIRHYSSSLDNRYVYISRSGRAYAIEHKQNPEVKSALYRTQFKSPVVQVFDVAQQPNSKNKQSFVLLPQPIPPALKDIQNSKIYVDKTTHGSFFALSEENFPSVTDGAFNAQLPDELIGVHDLTKYGGTIPLIGGPRPALPASYPSQAPFYPLLDAPTPQQQQNQQQQLQTDFQIQMEQSKWPLRISVILLLMTIVIMTPKAKSLEYLLFKLFPSKKNKSTDVFNPKLDNVEISQSQPEGITPADIDKIRSLNDTINQLDSSQPLIQEENKPTYIQKNQESKSIHESLNESIEKNVVVAEGFNKDANKDANKDENVDEHKDVTATPDNNSNNNNNNPPTPARKRRGARGKRIGKKKAKELNQRPSTPEAIEQPEKALDTVAQSIVIPDRQMKPDVISLPDGITDISEICQVTGSPDLLYEQNKVLGTGMHGTTVFSGWFKGKVVAVKRMLKTNYSVEATEIITLRKADNHQNIINYYGDTSDQHFVYIALEKCQASLDNLFMRGYDTTKSEISHLAVQIHLDIQRTLFQLIDGLSYLHELRIIHRDIKPQNILIAYPTTKLDQKIRIVISDFGLSRTLQDEQSTLATGLITGAGTTGWKAPEVMKKNSSILNQFNSDHQTSTPTTTLQHGIHTTNDSTVSNDVAQGIKRAADIFPMACVFYFIITKGYHPFDEAGIEEGAFYKREFNILENRKNYSRIEALGPESNLPLNMIDEMLCVDPKERPSAKQVKNHPFFWKPHEQLSFLCNFSNKLDAMVKSRHPDAEYVTEALEAGAYNIIPKTRDGKLNWRQHLDKKLDSELSTRRTYQVERVDHLLRALRNKHIHYEEASDEVKALFRNSSDVGFLQYWAARFPDLLIHCYKVAKSNGMSEELIERYMK